MLGHALLESTDASCEKYIRKILSGCLFKVLRAGMPAYDVLPPLGNAGQPQQEAEAAQQRGQYRLQQEHILPYQPNRKKIRLIEQYQMSLSKKIGAHPWSN